MKTQMRIALLAPLVSPIAPPFLGGAQALLADLAAGLAERGHEVTLYAADGSAVPGVNVPELGIDSQELTPARLGRSDLGASGDDGAADTKNEGDEDDERFGGLVPLDRDLYLNDYAFLRAYRAIAEHSGQHDVLHAHAYDAPAFAYSAIQPLPVVHTLHLPAQDEIINTMLAMVAPPQSSTSSTQLVTVSSACAATYLPFCRIAAVIYNGIPIERIPYAPHPASEEYLLYAGRISPEKGVEDALEIARHAGMHLILAGGIYDRDYYDKRVAPQLNGQSSGATYLGAVPREQLWQLMAGAQALLVPSYWDEPFGLVAAEAQATGTPVIGYARGGLPEVIADGVTGWLVAAGDRHRAAEAVAQVSRLDRAGCRRWVAERFGLDTMLDAYLAFYASMIGG
ncbi:MAG: glycosyltransferase [Ktedonobacterales bacterium]